jgi:predicted AAA+ superfamily ATPase
VGINDDVLAHIRNAWENKSKVDDFVHNKLIELFRLYLIVGGMPAAINAYLESNNLQNVIATQRDILTLYKKDISKYDPEDKLYIEEIFNLIPQELNAKNKRFILKKLNENIKFSKYENSFIWLKNAGVALPAYNVEEPKVPLILSRSRNLFKLFQNDLGILACQYTGNIQLRILSGDKDINFGSIYENAVAQELTANGFSPCYYNNKRRGGIDFIIEINGEVLPIEVKSGKDYEQHRALSNILDCTEYRIPQALVLSNDNLKVAGKIIYAPIYMTMFLKNDEITTTNYSIDLQGLI